MGPFLPTRASTCLSPFDFGDTRRMSGLLRMEAEQSNFFDDSATREIVCFCSSTANQSGRVTKRAAQSYRDSIKIFAPVAVFAFASKSFLSPPPISSGRTIMKGAEEEEVDYHVSARRAMYCSTILRVASFVRIFAVSCEMGLRCLPARLPDVIIKVHR